MIRHERKILVTAFFGRLGESVDLGEYNYECYARQMIVEAWIKGATSWTWEETDAVA